MPLTIQLRTTRVPEEGRLEFRRQVRRVHWCISMIRREMKLPSPNVTLLLTDGFEDAVRSIGSCPGFSASREGGRVAGKCLPQSSDWSSSIVVLDVEWWVSTTNVDKALQIALLAHEMAHPFIEHVRLATGAARPGESVGDGHWARNLKSDLVPLLNEYRADKVADVVLGMLVSSTRNGESIAASLWDLIGQDSVESLGDILRGAYPRWPRTVQDYREGWIDLQRMRDLLFPSVTSALVMLTHAQAHADAADQGEVLKTNELCNLPAVRLYLGQPWADFLPRLRTCSLLARGSFAECESSVLTAGEEMMAEVLASLGLRFSPLPDGQWFLHVGEPLW